MAFVTHFQGAFCRAMAFEILYCLGMCAEDETAGVKFQRDAKGEPCPHAELLCLAFPLFQTLILPDLNADQGGGLLLGKVQPDAGLTDDFMFPGDAPVQCVSSLFRLAVSGHTVPAKAKLFVEQFPVCPIIFLPLGSVNCAHGIIACNEAAFAANQITPGDRGDLADAFLLHRLKKGVFTDVRHVPGRTQPRKKLRSPDMHSP